MISVGRLARGREEWDSALLQNANTKCNGLLPVWGPHVPESAFATCLARSSPDEYANAHALTCLCVAFMTNFLSGQSTGTTHIYRSAQASGSPHTNSTSMTPNCCSSALLLNSHSAWILEEEGGRATYTSFPTSSTLCFMSSTRA